MSEASSPSVIDTSSPRWIDRPLRLSRALARIGVAFAILGVLAELTARLYDARAYGIPFNATPDVNDDLVIRDSIGLRGRPNGKYLDRQLNSGGFRSPESALTPMPGCVRVMVLGSSESFGYEEPNGEEYPAQLADSLGTRGCFQVMNAAIVGFSLPLMHQLYERWGARFSPDIVVIMANPLPYIADEPPRAPAPLLVESREVRRQWRPRLLSKVRGLVNYPAFIQRRRIERMVDQLVTGRPPEWFFREVPAKRLALFRSDVDSLVAKVLAQNATPMLLVHPIRFRSLSEADAFTEMQAMRQFGGRALPEVLLQFDRAGGDAVRAIAALRGVPVVDLPPLMNGRHEFFADPVHYTPAGSAVVARTVAGAISRWRNDSTVRR